MSLTVENYESLCEKVSELDPTVIVAAVLSRGKVVASRVRPGIFIPEGKALERILLQLEMLVGIPKTNENLYGKVGYVVVNHGSGDHMLFPTGDGHMMIVSVVSPYAHQLIRRVQDMMRDAGITAGPSPS